MLELRQYQKELIDKIKSEMLRGRRSILAVLGCGGGKSLIQAEIARAAADKGNHILFLVHRKELVQQITETFTRQGVDMKLCTVGMVQTLCRRCGKLTAPAMIITDEAHHSLAKSYTTIYDSFPDAYRIGFTATPVRLDGKGLCSVYESMVEGVSTRWLIDNGYLADYRAYGVQLIDTSKLHRRAGEFVQQEVDALLANKAIYGDVFDTWRRIAYGKKTIIYCASVKSSCETAETFEKYGITSASLDGSARQIERQRTIDKFRAGEITVLCNVDLFGEGFDVPDCECVVMLRPTLSLSLHIQQSMRSMRYKEGKTAIIIDHVGNIYRHGFPDEPREWQLKDREKRIRGGAGEAYKSKIRQCGKCLAVVPSKCVVCPCCGSQLTAGREELERRQAEITELKLSDFQKRDYNDYKQLKTFDELNLFRKARGYKFMWVLRKCVELGIPYPDNYRYMARRFLM